MHPYNKLPSLDWLAEKQYDVSILTTGIPQDVIQSTPHRRTYHELFFLQSGKGEIKIDEQLIAFESNTLYCIWEGQVHQFLNATTQNGFAIRFTNEFILQTDANMTMVLNANLFNRIRQLNKINLWSGREITSFTTLFQQITEEARLVNTTFGQKQSIQYLLMTLLVKLARKADTLPLQNTFYKGKDLETFQTFLTLLEENYFLHHNIEFYAKTMGIKTRKLTDIIRKNTDKTGKQFINEKVIQESKRLLCYTHSSLKEIAHNLGFKNQTYFCYAFKKETEMSPLAYRKKHASI